MSSFCTGSEEMNQTLCNAEINNKNNLFSLFFVCECENGESEPKQLWTENQNNAMKNTIMLLRAEASCIVR